MGGGGVLRMSGVRGCFIDVSSTDGQIPPSEAKGTPLNIAFVHTGVFGLGVDLPGEGEGGRGIDSQSVSQSIRHG